MPLHRTIAAVLKWGSEILTSSSPSAMLDVEVCLQHCLKCNRTYLYTWPEKSLTDDEWHRFNRMIKERQSGMPIAHITGYREFWSLPFQVNNTTLIPRPDTEILVETALGLSLPDNAHVLDLGTGTGAIALSLAHEKPHWKITAVDKISDAVALAIANRDHLQLFQVDILQSDWFSALKNKRFDLIISNPPYIDENDHHLEEGDVRFEPKSALTADDHGYADLFYIAKQALHFLSPNGYLLMEHGFQQGEQLRSMLQQLGYRNIDTIRDYGRNERCTSAQHITATL